MKFIFFLFTLMMSQKSFANCEYKWVCQNNGNCAYEWICESDPPQQPGDECGWDWICGSDGCKYEWRCH